MKPDASVPDKISCCDVCGRRRPYGDELFYWIPAHRHRIRRALRRWFG